MRLVTELDAGPVYLSKDLGVDINEDAIGLTAKLSTLGADALVEALLKITNEDLKPTEQEHAESTYAPKLSRELSPIDFSKSGKQIHNQIRALVPWPVAQTSLEGKRLKVYVSEALEQSTDAPVGQVVHMGQQGWTVSTGGVDLLLKEVQFEGKKRMNAFDLANGLRLEVGCQLGGD